MRSVKLMYIAPALYVTIAHTDLHMSDNRHDLAMSHMHHLAFACSSSDIVGAQKNHLNEKLEQMAKCIALKGDYIEK